MTILIFYLKSDYVIRIWKVKINARISNNFVENHKVVNNNEAYHLLKIFYNFDSVWKD